MVVTYLRSSRCGLRTTRIRVLSTSTTSSLSDVTSTSVVIVGGGPTGLLLSNLLSLYGTPSILLESQTSKQRFAHPQAHFLNTRTMEILRHSLPSVYEEVWKKVPPVGNWNHFQWGSSMVNPLARVRHPVDMPLNADMDGNGKLVQDAIRGDGSNMPSEGKSDESQSRPLSVCSVAHLAQHHFCRILWESAKQNAVDESSVQYGVAATNTEETDEDPEFPISVTTSQGQTIRTKFVVAADGANSTLRRKVWKIGVQGQERMQSLVNVHIKTSATVSDRLHTNGNNAMLHFIYHPSVVAVVVCHDVGEYVLQIPFFPPYQTLEEDFSKDNVRNMVECALGIPNHITTTEEDLDIVSVRPWTMSSLIAERYVSGDRCVLAGDSAHVFPPAGGLGMNTGLQDVYNLAWRLSWIHENITDSDNEQLLARSTLRQYERERRRVAQQNAALSVRNYNRTLKLAKACYLNDQHPQALITILSSPPFSFLPLAARQDTFRTLVSTGMWPLRALQNHQSIHSERVKKNVLGVLNTGSGLPLLFPKFELGFSYIDDEDLRETPHQDRLGFENDTKGYSPRVQVGFLFPHVVMEIASPRRSVVMKLYPHLRPIEERVTSEDAIHLTTTDMPAQLQGGPFFGDLRVNSQRQPPVFVLFLLDCNNSVIEFIEECIPRLDIPIQVVHIVLDTDREHRPSQQSNVLTLADTKSALKPMLRPLGKEPKVVLVRPDGHVARICVVTASEEETVTCAETAAIRCSIEDVHTHLKSGVCHSL